MIFSIFLVSILENRDFKAEDLSVLALHMLAEVSALFIINFSLLPLVFEILISFRAFSNIGKVNPLLDSEPLHPSLLLKQVLTLFQY